MSQFEKIYTIGQVRRFNAHSLQTSDHMYRFELGEAIGWRYEAVNLLDKGAFGIVIKAKDCKTDGFVAIKLSKNQAFDVKNAKVEVDLLTKMMNYEELSDAEGYESIVSMIDQFKFRSHQAIVFELLDLNLFRFQ